MPKINREEYEVLKELDDKWKWIARNYNGALITFTSKPTKNPNLYWDSFGERMEDRLFRFIQWEDESPYNIQELIEEYLYDNQPKLFIDGQEQSFEFIEESEEKEVKKDLNWFKEKLELLKEIDRKMWEKSEPNSKNQSHFNGSMATIDKVLDFLSQLDEPEILSQEWLNENKSSWTKLKIDGYYIPVEKLQNLLVPKQDEVDRAYKDGYEKGKQHATEKQSEETETVARVLVDYLIASAKLKLVLSMETEELEEC